MLVANGFYHTLPHFFAAPQTLQKNGGNLENHLQLTFGRDATIVFCPAIVQLQTVEFSSARKPIFPTQ
jgi:hypothetical protein